MTIDLAIVDRKEDTWEPYDKLDCSDLIEAFEDKLKIEKNKVPHQSNVGSSKSYKSKEFISDESSSDSDSDDNPLKTKKKTKKQEEEVEEEEEDSHSDV